MRMTGWPGQGGRAKSRSWSWGGHVHVCGRATVTRLRPGGWRPGGSQPGGRRPGGWLLLVRLPGGLQPGGRPLLARLSGGRQPDGWWSPHLLFSKDSWAAMAMRG